MQSIAKTCRTVPIDRVCHCSPAQFCETYLAGTGKPVIVTNALDSWPALSLWNFDLFRKRYGSEFILIRTWLGQIYKKLMKFRDFLDYVEDPDRPIPGFWVDPVTLHPCPAPTEKVAGRFYLPWNVFGKHPELLSEVRLSPSFVEDWLPLLPHPLRKVMDEATRYFMAGLMIGPKDSQIGLHVDFLDTHAYLAQIVGRKRCKLFSPEDSQFLYNGKVSVDAPDLARHPLFHKATMYECVLEPGELLFMPHLWWHHIVAMDPSITVNYNFFNHVNFTNYMTRLFQILPDLVEGIEKSGEERTAMEIEWKCRGFDYPEFK
jgi:hypothetical protein